MSEKKTDPDSGNAGQEASRKAEEALRESEEKFHSILAQVSDLILLLDIPPEGTPVIQDVSDSVFRLLGYARADLIGKPVSILDHDISDALIADRRKAVSEGRSFEVKHLCKNGTVREFECSATMRMVGRKNMGIAVERDITERRKAEEELRFHAALLDNAVDAIQALELDGKLVYVNDAVVRTTGYSRAELIGKSVSILDSSADAALASARIKQLLKNGAAKFNMLRIRKDGTSFPVEASASVMAMGGKEIIIAVDRDVTERKEAETDIHESYEIQGVLNTILQQSLMPLPLQKKLGDHLATLLSIPWLAVEPKGAVFVINGQTLTLTVQQGLSPAILSACEKLPFGKCLCGRAAESGQIVTSPDIGPDHEIVHEGITPHGHYCAPIIAGGKTLGVLNLYLKVGTIITGKRKDFLKAVTDILAADILHARIEEQFAQSQKMEAIGHMAGGIAHDFNNILSAIMGYSSFLSASIPADDPRHADVDEIRKAGERAAALTRQLLSFSRKQVVQFTVLSVDKIVPEVTKMIRRMVGEDIEFKTFLNSAPAQVLANQGQLEQVLINLAVNARDAMPDGGKLTFETAQVELDENYTANHPGFNPGRYVMLAVSDTGHGMSPEVAARIFEPFFTTKEQGKGTGLGLSTVYGIVKQSGGGVYVYSEAGKGTTFKIYLPVAAGQTGAEPPEKPPLASYRGTETILLVEDDESIRKVVYRLLSYNGYSVMEAATPGEAIALCELHHDIHLMLTDMVMPQMNGYELSKVVSTMLPRMKVIFMSGYTDNAITRQNLLAPGVVLLEKPLKTETVLRKIREMLDAKP
jgi:PAS domain S-box-containing protein